MTKQLLSGLAIVAMVNLALTATSANAEVIATTNFDGHGYATVSIANDTATGLNWALNGIEDPGDMTSVMEDGSPLALFNGSATTQNMFAPALNVGNTDTGWRATIDLTASAGSTVTLTDVTFVYWAINGGQSPNVARRSDFTLTLYDPSAAPVGSVFIDDSNGDPTDEISAVFAAPITLSDPGTYTLEIFATEAPETGNHIGIDDLSINGTVVVPEPSSLVLVGLGVFGLIGLGRRRKR